jgi:hypothetical protein
MTTTRQTDLTGDAWVAGTKRTRSYALDQLRTPQEISEKELLTPSASGSVMVDR